MNTADTTYTVTASVDNKNYTLKKSTASTTFTINVGEYVAQITVGGATASADFTISEAPPLTNYTLMNFSYDSTDFDLTGQQIIVSNIIKKAGLTGDVTAVSVSDTSLLSAVKSKGKWVVRCTKAFRSDEWIRVTIGGTVYKIAINYAIEKGECGANPSASVMWEIDDGKLTIAREESYNDSGIVAMADYASYNDTPWYGKSFTTVFVNSNVKNVGTHSFDGNTDIKNVTVYANGVENIGAYAFNGCTGITRLNIGSGVQSIGEYAFTGCTALKSVSIPSSVSSIENNAFKDCMGIANVTIASGAGNIGTSAFDGCTSLESISVPSSVNSIGTKAFNGCTSLQNVTIYGTAAETDVASDAFKGVNNAALSLQTDRLEALVDNPNANGIMHGVAEILP